MSEVQIEAGMIGVAGDRAHCGDGRSPNVCMTRILWIAPNFNHYKKRFLARLVAEREVDIVMLAGRSAQKEGHHDDVSETPFDIVRIPTVKNRFAFRPAAYVKSFQSLVNMQFDVVMMPAEKKFLPLILWFALLRPIFGFRLLTYNHPVLRTRRDRISKRDLVWTRCIFLFYDCVIFYTQEARDWAVTHGLLPSEKAAFANNTLDTETIRQNYYFEINRKRPFTLLFIARLISSKRLELLFDYYRALKAQLPSLRLIVIGDGPQADRVRTEAKADPDIRWCGALVDEVTIAKEMRKAHAVFVPGWSGLSIVHAFSYGKPYITQDQMHPPEIAYLRDGENGLLLADAFAENVDRIRALLEGEEAYARACRAAFETAKRLSIENWCAQMTEALTKGAGRLEARQTGMKTP